MRLQWIAVTVMAALLAGWPAGPPAGQTDTAAGPGKRDPRCRTGL